MFCPKCSQQQINDETRFCSRCGFQLNVVKALLVEDNSPQTLEIPKKGRALRKRDMTIGAGLMFVFAFIVAAITADMPPLHSARIIILIMAWLALTLLINIKPIFQYFVRGESSAADDNILPAKFTSRLKPQTETQNSALPPAQSIPADFVMPDVNTAEMKQPLSVTESTTNLLNKQ